MNEARTALPIEISPDDTMAAFLGALDDIAAVTTQPDTTVGAEFTERVLGLFDTASTFYESDMARNVKLMNALTAKLGQMSCGGHDHITDALEAISAKYSEHDHDEEGESKEEENKKKRRAKDRQGFMWLLIHENT